MLKMMVVNKSVVKLLKPFEFDYITEARPQGTANNTLKSFFLAVDTNWC